MKHLEKPIILNNDDLEQIAFIVENFIRTLNNTVFKFISNRTVENKNKEKGGERLYDSEWTWVFEKDISRFEKYYSIFSAKTIPFPDYHYRIHINFLLMRISLYLLQEKIKKTEKVNGTTI
jgi:hypothetical protein